jgi:hypothetical protein
MLRGYRKLLAAVRSGDPWDWEADDDDDDVASSHFDPAASSEACKGRVRGVSVADADAPKREVRPAA